VLKDAVDLLERKIQLLEQKGWFRDVEHRREALDRLLPTIRAARDPITRDLYLSLVAERTGVSKAVLEQELTHAPPEPPPPPPPMPRDEPPSQKRSAGRGNALRPGSPQERIFLRVLVHFDGWIERARDDIAPSFMESPETREVYEALLAHGDRNLPIETLDRMSPDSRRLWGEINRPMTEADTMTAGDIYEWARQNLEARPHFREYENFLDRLKRAQGEEKARLAGEQVQRRNDLKARFPIAAEKYFLGLVGRRLRRQREGHSR
jgi:DNA primase